MIRTTSTQETIGASTGPFTENSPSTNIFEDIYHAISNWWKDDFYYWLDISLIWNELTIYHLVTALIILVFGILIRNVFVRKTLGFALFLARKTETELDDIAIEAIRKPLLFYLMWLLGYFVVVILPADKILLSDGPPPFTFEDFAYEVISLVLLLNITWFLLNLIGRLAVLFREKAKKNQSNSQWVPLIPLLEKSAKVMGVLVMIAIVIDALGYSVTSVVTGMGIGGLAIALAAKEALSNIFGSMMIFTDKPFEVGDWIITDKYEGDVVSVGIRSTRIRQFDKSLVSIPNSDIANKPIVNMTRRNIFGKGSLQRIKEWVGFTYSSSTEDLEGMVQTIRQLILDNPKMFHDYFQVYFNRFGASSLEILVYCFVQAPSWAEYLEERQNLFLKIMKEAERRGLSFAFPSTSVYFENKLGFSGGPLNRLEELYEKPDQPGIEPKKIDLNQDKPNSEDKK